LTRADIDEFAEAIFKLASGGVATREAEVLAQRYRNAARRFADTTASPEFEYRRLLREAMAQLEPRPGFSQGRRREVLNRARDVLSNALRRN